MGGAKRGVGRWRNCASWRLRIERELTEAINVLWLLEFAAAGSVKTEKAEIWSVQSATHAVSLRW